MAATVRRSGPSRITRYLVGFGLMAVFVLLVWFISSDLAGNPQGVADPPPGTQSFQFDSADHTPDPVQYAQDPPAGGNHHASPLTCGVYDEPVANEFAVHSLEHGAMWITYMPELDQASIDNLEEFARRAEVIVSPYPGLDSPIVVTAWGRQLRLQSVDDGLIDQFYRAFHDRVAPEPNGVC